MQALRQKRKATAICKVCSVGAKLYGSKGTDARNSESFIDKIYIGKPERIDGKRVQEVKIVYKLVGAVNMPQ